MTPRNITAGFRATGVFPVNRYAISLPGERPRPSGTPTAVLAEKKGINFMPFYSPTCRKAEFSCEEQELFRHRFEDGYDLTHDCRGAGDEGGKPGKSVNSCDIKINMCRVTWHTTAVNSLLSVVDRLRGSPMSTQDCINMGLLQ